MRIKHQVDINATETVKGKLTFEREAQSYGLVIKGNHNDNNIFDASDFMEELLKKQQNIMFSGAGTSHQNGSAEHAIKTGVAMARNMLIHDPLRFPDDNFSVNLWKIEIGYAVWVFTCISDMQYGLSAIEIWSRSRFETVAENLRNSHVCGCPTYLLESKLHQSGVNSP